MDIPRSSAQNSASPCRLSQRSAIVAGCKIKILSAVLAAAAAMSAAYAADNSKPADPTVTIACFGSDLALTSTVGSGDSLRLCAEVLDFGQATTVPKGRVAFMVDGSSVGPAAGVALQPGQDPRTGQPAGIASASFSSLHLAPGKHTVKARYIPAGGQFLASQSLAAGNLQFNNSTMVASAGSSSSLPPARPGSMNPGKETLSETPASYNLVEPAGARFWASGQEDITWFLGGDAHALIVSGASPSESGVVSPTTKLSTAPGFIGLKNFGEVENPFNLKNPTNTEFGNSLDTGAHNGQEAQLGFWLDPEETRAIEGSFFYTESSSTDFTSPGGTVTAIPYLNLGTGQMTAYTVSQPFTTYSSNSFINTTPGVYVLLHTDTVGTTTTGNATASILDRMWGTDLKFRKELPTGGHLAEASFSLGASYFNYFESLGIGSNVSTYTTDATVYDKALGLTRPNYTDIYQSSATESDNFTTHNQFYGLQGGLRAKYQWGRLWVSGEGLLGIGLMAENLEIHGHGNSSVTSTITPTKTIKLAGIPLQVANGKPAVTTTTTTNSTYGLFAQPQNSGDQTDDKFAVVPSVSLKIGYDITPSLTVFAGYEFFFVSDIARPSDQINQRNFTDNSFYGQTAEFGLKVSF